MSTDASNLGVQGTQDDGTKALLVEILAELKSLGAQLARPAQVDTQVAPQLETTGLEDGSSAINKPATLWRSVVAEMKNVSASRLSTAKAIHIYKNDLVGVDQLGKEDEKFSNIGARDPSFEESRLWTELAGHIWRVPEDGRLPLRFVKSWLLQQGAMRLPSDPLPAPIYLQRLADDEDVIPLQQVFRLPFQLASSNITIWDYFEKDMGIKYDIERKPTRPFEEPSFMEKSWSLSTKMPKMCSSGPWRRIVCLRGSEYRTIPWLRGPLPYHLKVTLRAYRHCYRRQRDTRWVEWDAGCQRFHVTYYNIQYSRPSTADHAIPHWKQGPLHSGKKNQILCESAYTVLLIPEFERLSDSSRDYWSMLDLRPEQFPAPHSNVIITLGARIDVLQAILIMADNAMKTVQSYWKDILDYFDQLISESDTFLDPERHDRLLSDDESFSRSKRYFWAITALKELDLSISDNLLQMKRLLDTRSSSWVESSRKGELEDARSCLQIRYREIEQIAIQLREKRQEAVDLRDGLFSASAVIESRSATRLGENVKLLTFVSIFFLPLSFCMSVWSINTLFSLNSLILVATLVALSTYFTVFNLDSIVTFYKDAHRRIFSFIILRMKNDRDELWRERGKAFDKFASPRRATNKPSDWRLLQYAIGKALWGNRKDSKKKLLDESRVEIDRRGSSFKIWRRRSKVSSSSDP